MTVSTPSKNLGRHVFWGGGFGLWLHHAGLARLQRLASTPLPYLLCRRCQIFGGAAIQFGRTTKGAQSSLPAVYLVFALLCVQESSPHRRSTIVGQLLRAVLSRHRTAIVYGALVIGLVTGTLARPAAFCWLFVAASLLSNRPIYLLTLPPILFRSGCAKSDVWR